MATEFEAYLESDDAVEDFGAWLVAQAAENPVHPMFAIARATWEASDDCEAVYERWIADYVEEFGARR